MLSKGTKTYSIIRNKCPRCMEAPFFISNNPYKPGSMITMDKYCPNCGLDYGHEPGFYIGAMYVSYAQGIAIALATGIVSQLFFHVSFNQTLQLIAAMLLITSPLNFRVSRLVWINIWVSYDADAITHQQEKQLSCLRHADEGLHLPA